MPVSPLELRLYSESGAFSPSQMDQQWTDIQNYVNALNGEVSVAADTLSNLVSTVGTPVLFGAATYNASAIASLDIPVPDGALWDELEFHFSLLTSESASLGLRISNDGGSTYFDGVNDYQSSVNGSLGSLTNQIPLGPANASTTPTTGFIRHVKTLANAEPYFDASVGTSRTATGGQIVKGWKTGNVGATGPITNIRLLMSAGTMTGRVSVFRVKYP